MEDTSMDAQTMVIVVVIFIISAIILYLMSVYGFREKSYEEVIMEQRMMAEEETGSKKDKKDKKKKVVKRTGKKEKVTVTTTTTTVHSEEQEKKDEEVTKMVQLEIDPEIIETAPAAPEKEKKSHGRENVSKKNREKEKEKIKSILTNKDETSIVKETVETVHHGLVPKDELQMRLERQVIPAAPEVAAAPEPSNKKKRDKRAAKEEAKKEEAKKEEAKKEEAKKEEANKKEEAKKEETKKEEAKKQEEPVEKAVRETVVQKSVVEEVAAVRSEATTRKSKKERTPPVKAALASGDNKSSAKDDSEEWIKKSKQGDPMVLLKRQLEDKERALAEEQQSCLGAKMKLKEVHQELTNERNRLMIMEAQSKQNLQEQAEEIKALHARMQQTHEQHHAEVNAMKYQVEQIGAQRGNEGAVHRIQRLEQENKQLQEAVSHAQAARNSIDASGMQQMQQQQQQIKILQDELQKNVGKLTMAENAREKFDNQLKKSENAHKDTEAVLKKRLGEMNEALKHMENKNKQMSYELDGATGTLAKRENELSTLRNQMKDMDKAANSHNGNMIRNLENKLSDAEKQRVMYEDQMRKLQQNLKEVEAMSGRKDDELKMLKNENASLKSNRQRTSGEGQEAAVVREEPCGQVQAQKMSYDTNNIVKEQETALVSLQQEVKKLQVEKDSGITQLQGELKQLQSERDQLQSTSKNTETAVNKLQEQLNALKSEKDSAVIQLQKIQQEKQTLTVQLQAISKDQGSAVTKLQEEIHTLQANNSTIVNQLQVDLQKVRQEKDDLSNKLQSSSRSQDSTAAQLQDDIKKLTADLEKQRQKNNALREKNWKAMDALSKAEKMAEAATDLKSSLANKDSEIDRLKTLIKQNNDSAELQQKDSQLRDMQAQVSNRDDELTNVQQQLQQLQASYDELQTKSAGQDKVDGGHSASQQNDQQVALLQTQIQALQQENSTLKSQPSAASQPKLKQQELQVQQVQYSQVHVTQQVQVENMPQTGASLSYASAGPTSTMMAPNKGSSGVAESLHEKEQSLIRKLTAEDTAGQRSPHRELSNRATQEEQLEAQNPLICPEVKALRDEEHALIWALADTIKEEERLGASGNRGQEARLQELHTKERVLISKLTETVEKEKVVTTTSGKGKLVKGQDRTSPSSKATDSSDDLEKLRLLLDQKEKDLHEQEEDLKQRMNDFEVRYKEFNLKEKPLQESQETQEPQEPQVPKKRKSKSKKEKNQPQVAAEAMVGTPSGEQIEKSKEVEQLQKEMDVGENGQPQAPKEVSTSKKAKKEVQELTKVLEQKEQDLRDFQQREEALKQKLAELESQKQPESIQQEPEKEASTSKKSKKKSKESTKLLEQREKDLEQREESLKRREAELENQKPAEEVQKQSEKEVSATSLTAAPAPGPPGKKGKKDGDKPQESSSSREQDYDSMLKELTKREAELQNSRQMLEKEYAEKKTEMIEREQKFEEKWKQLQGKEAEVNVMKEKFEQQSSKKAKEKEKGKSSREEELNKKLTEVETRLKEINKLEEEVRVERVKISEKVTELQRKEGELVKVTKDTTDKKVKESRDLEGKTKQIEDKEKALRSREDELRKKMDELKKRETDFDSRRAQVDKLETGIKQERARIEEKETELNKKEQQLTKSSQDVKQTFEAQVASAKTSANDTIQDLNRQIEQLRSEITEKNSANATSNNTAQDLTRQLEQLRQEITTKNSTIDNLQQQHNKDNQSRTSEFEQQTVTLTTRLTETQTELLQTKKQFEAEVNRLKSEAAAAAQSKPVSSPADVERMRTLERDLSQRDASISDLRSQIDSLNSQLSELLKNQQRNEESQTIAAKSMQELAQIKNDFNARLAEFERTKQELELLRKENHALQAGGAPAVVSQEKVNGSSSETRNIKGVTVVTRVEEKSTLDVSRILADKDALYAELQVLRSILSSKEKELEELREKYGETDSESTHTETEFHKHTHTTLYMQGKTVSLRDLELLRKNLHARDLHIQSLQTEINRLKDDKHEFQEKIVQHQIELHSASGEVQDSILENLEFKSTELVKLQEIVKEYWNINNELKDRLSVYEDSEADEGSTVSSWSSSTRRSTRSRDSQAEMVGDLQKQLASKASQLGKLSEEVVAIKREAEELREKNSKAVDTVLKSESSGAKSDASTDKQQRATRELLQRLFPHVSVRSSLGHNEWMSAFEREASKYLKSQSKAKVGVSSSSDIDSQLEEYRENQGKLQAQVQHYEKVLAETEGILTRLQNSVENEETKWQQRVKTAEEDASKAKEENKRLKSELEGSGPAGKAALAASTNGEGTSV